MNSANEQLWAPMMPSRIWRVEMLLRKIHAQTKRSYVLPEGIAHARTCLLDGRRQGTLPGRVADDVRESHACMVLAYIFLTWDY